MDGRAAADRDHGMTAPLIGITTDLADDRHRVAAGYSRRVRQAGGVPVLLPCMAECAAEYADRCDGLVLTGGDDPIMEQWGIPTHPSATPIDARRQAFELALLAVLDAAEHKPVLGICLGMQLIGLHGGGALDQHLPQTLVTAGEHWPQTRHPVAGALGEGLVHSHHRQALRDAGALSVVATAPDGVIEAVRDERRPFYVGVQWHPERTHDPALGAGLFSKLVACARR